MESVAAGKQVPQEVSQPAYPLLEGLVHDIENGRRKIVDPACCPPQFIPGISEREDAPVVINLDTQGTLIVNVVCDRKDALCVGPRGRQCNKSLELVGPEDSVSRCKTEGALSEQRGEGKKTVHGAWRRLDDHLTRYRDGSPEQVLFEVRCFLVDDATELARTTSNCKL